MCLVALPFALGSSARGSGAEDPSGTDPAAVTETTEKPAPVEDLPNPRLTLSYVHFSIGNVDTTSVPLDGAHLDVYPLSQRWLRAGIELESGRGSASLLGKEAALTYALAGGNAGVQMPLGRVTPFAEARFTAGLLHGRTVGPISDVGGTITSTDATTYLYAYGLSIGTELYIMGRGYLSLSIGWLRTTWRGPKETPATQTAQTTFTLDDITHDALALKLGLGL